MSAPVTILIVKDTMNGIVPNWTNNVNDDTFNAASLAAAERLINLIPSTLNTQLEYWYNVSEWASGTAYVVGNRVKYDNRGYICIQNGTGQNPATQTAYWTEKEMFSIYRDYIKPFMCWQTYAELLPFYGQYVSQSGLKKHIEAYSSDLEDNKRSAMINNAQSKADRAFIRFIKYMDNVSYVIDSVTYTFDSDVTQHKTKIKIFNASI